MQELRSPVEKIKQPEEHCADHSNQQEAAMMLGQRNTSDRYRHRDRPTSDSDHACVKGAYPLLVNLEQSPQPFRIHGDSHLDTP